MPTTRMRSHLQAFAVEQFNKQDYIDKELIILHDGDSQEGSTNSEYQIRPNIKLISLAGKRKTGDKRNICCQHATGDIIIHQDDDDHYAPDWITMQVAALKQSGADICGLPNIYFYKPDDNTTWEYQYKNGKRWVAGATMSYWRDWWVKHPFKDVQIGEDFDFVMQSNNVAYSAYQDGFIARIHPGNTSFKDVKQYKQVNNSIARAILGADFNKFCEISRSPQI